MTLEKLMFWGCVSGFVASVFVTVWPATWQYAPGVIFGVTLAVSFITNVWAGRKNKFVLVLETAAFIVASALAYHFALFAAEWVLGTNGFADFSSYGSESAMSALFVACFVGGCIGAVVLSLGIRLFFFRFNLLSGVFLFGIAAGALSSVIIVGFELFGFIPQFLFPVWHVGATAVIGYLYRGSVMAATGQA